MDIKKESKLIKLTFPNTEDMPEDLYSNSIVVVHGEDDFILYFAKIDPPLMINKEIQVDEIKAKIVARIRLTPTVAEKLKIALEQNINNYKELKK